MGCARSYLATRGQRWWFSLEGGLAFGAGGLGLGWVWPRVAKVRIIVGLGVLPALIERFGRGVLTLVFGSPGHPKLVLVRKRHWSVQLNATQGLPVACRTSQWYRHCEVLLKGSVARERE